MKKILLFIVLLIFLCGCASVYDVNHYNSKGFREQRPFVENKINCGV